MSRRVVIASAAVAILMEALLGSREWGPLLDLTLLILLAAWALAKIRPALASGIVLGSVYLVPALFLAWLGRDQTHYQVTWMAALFGVVLAQTPRDRWAFPGRWKAPLVFWALVLALTWPIVVARECDFRSFLLLEPHIGNSRMGGTPADVAVWVLYVTLTYLVGLLWFDSLFRTCAGDARRFRRMVAVPLGIGALLASLVAIYQGAIDIAWLNTHQWPSLHRASGTLLDGDAFGALAGFWSSAFLGFTAAASPVMVAFGVVGAIAAWGGMWATAARMGLLAALIGLAFIVWQGGVWLWRMGRRRLLLSLGIGAIVIVAGLAVIAGPRLLTSGPVARAYASLPSLSRASLAKFVREDLYNRGAPYGTVSMMMVRESPLVGVGVGTFNEMFPDYAELLGVTRTFDNAQSWYRHQLAELGIAGSLGWIAWGAMFLWLLLTTGASGWNGFAAGVVKGTLVTIGLIALVSMPMQNAAVSLTVWAFAFWYLTLIPEAHGFGRIARGRTPRWMWVAVWLVAVSCVAGTTWEAWHEFRPPYRAQRADWDYAYGFYPIERPANAPAFRWTKRETVAVFRATGSYLKLTFWIHHPDAAQHPVEVKIWRKDPGGEREIVNMQLHDGTPVTVYVHVPPGGHFDHMLMLETWVSRTWTPSAQGGTDTRQLGLGIDDWTFVDTPPPGAMVIN